MAFASPEGLWKANTDMELAARRALRKDLEPFERAYKDLYEAAVLAPTLTRKRSKNSTAAALFLKRALVDFRATWLLVEQGYTSSAAAVAASLWEHSLAVSAFVAAGETIPTLEPSGDLPWTPKQLADFATEAPGDNRAYNVYSAYKWLCKVKHPTMRSATHDSRATASGDSEYVVMSAPDIRPEDASAKRVILTLAFARVSHAIQEFTGSIDPDVSSLQYKEYDSRLTRANEAMAALAIAHRQEPLPFHLVPHDFKRPTKGQSA